MRYLLIVMLLISSAYGQEINRPISIDTPNIDTAFYKKDGIYIYAGSKTYLLSDLINAHTYATDWGYWRKVPAEIENYQKSLENEYTTTIDSLQNLLDTQNRMYVKEIQALLEYQQYACEVIQSLRYRKIRGTASPRQRVLVDKNTVKAVSNYYKRYGYENRK